MQIYGLNKTTLLDFPEHVAATVFTGGCNFCCPFCHNRDLVLGMAGLAAMAEEEVLAFLKKRKGILTGVCITGGEPALQPDLPDFIERIREMGYLVKLDTNGYRPEVLRGLLEKGLLDYVAMDIKNTKERYAVTVGRKDLDIGRIEESVEMLKASSVAGEFRTTVVRELHRKEDFAAIGEWLAGADAYFLQAYQDNENVIQGGFTAYDRADMEELAEMVRRHVARVALRGIA